MRVYSKRFLQVTTDEARDGIINLYIYTPLLVLRLWNLI